jgi:organic radical activating enzyme
VCVTGGEPLAQINCHILLDRLVKENYQVSLETSGSIDIADINPGVSIEWTACEAHKYGRQTHFSRFAL